MKKILTMIVVSLCVLGLCACFEDPNITTYYQVNFETNGGTKIESISVAEGTKVTEPDSPTREGYKFLGWFNNKNLTETYDFNNLVSGNLTIYAGWEVEQMILVLDSQLNNSFVEYYSNKEEKENKKTEFFDLTKAYLVGDDNAWSAKPNVTFISYNPETSVTKPITVQSWTYDIKIYDGSIVSNKESIIDLTNSDYIDSIDYNVCTIDFSEKAIGKTFVVIVCPTGLTEKQQANVENYITRFTINVVDGYNVYSALELAYIENRTSGEEAEAWNNFKIKNGLSLDYHPTNLILQKSLEVKTEDLPEYFFYQENELSKSDSDYERALGSMKDYKSIYFKTVSANEEFKIIGNYFTLSFESLKEIIRENNSITPDGEVISHSNLFRFEGDGSAQVVMEDLNIIGNAPRVENSIKAGGIIMNKVEGPKFVIRNTITVCCFIAFFPNYTDAEYLIDKCKAYDSFNCFVYNWGATNVKIQDSEMIGAGGPVIIQDHVDPNTSNSRIPNTVVVNSKLESYVTGSEGWFTVVKASAVVPQIKALNQIFTTVGRSFLKANKDNSLQFLNLICVNKSSNNEGLTSEKVSGSLAIDDALFDYGATNPYLKQMLDITFTAGAPTFQSSLANATSGYGYYSGSGLVDVSNNAIQDLENPIFSGDYLCLYFNGMAIVLGYGPAGEVYLSE